jgi:hypothetical protein
MPVDQAPDAETIDFPHDDVPEPSPQDKLIDSLEQLITFYKDNPEFPIPPEWYLHFNIEVAKSEDLAPVVKMLAPCKKRSSSYDFQWSRKFGIWDIRVSVYKSKVCQKVKTGKKKWIAEKPPTEAVPGFWQEEEVWECDGIPNGDDPQDAPNESSNIESSSE